ncbi:MAG: GNAT family N-acetyltransferase [Alphaproteobacteria bacterium]|nr:GNAT family N-acetyltransferase [Alphaproteobacteria bacterium]MBV9371342.1 GNAT family N-acetyltransferase [Alphaproteobacteria bacterium]MBV9901806.1 GNAT family N-acetyltransferase [Alphaproteobacteria bacterium]
MFARTERLLLRPGWVQDAPALHRVLAEEAIVRNLATAPWPYRYEDAEAFLATERGPENPVMLVFLREAGAPRLIGTIGLSRRPGEEVELGYWIGRHWWNRGFATEAGRAVVAMARDSLRLPRLAAGHFIDNPASGRVLEKLGFAPTGEVVPRFSVGRGMVAPCRTYGLTLREEAEGKAEEAAMAA